jgi:hypothetical protein
MGLDDPIIAMCDCGEDCRTTSYRKLKKSWPKCRCKQMMKVYDGNPNSPIPARNRVGYEGPRMGRPRKERKL